MRAAEQLPDAAADPRELEDLGVAYAVTLGRTVFDPAGSATLQRHDSREFVSPTPFYDLAGAGADDEMIGVRDARNHRLAQAVARVEHGLQPAAGQGIGGEQDAGDRRTNHALDDHREPRVEGIDA